MNALPLLADRLFASALRPEYTIMVGIILMIIVPNLGDAKVRIPLTKIRIPVLIGGRRFKSTSDPSIPMTITIMTLLLAMVNALFTFAANPPMGAASACITAAGLVDIGCNDVTKYILRADPFSRMMEIIFYASLMVVATAMVHRMPATTDATAPSKNADASMRQRMIARLLDNRRQVDFHLLILFVALGMSIVALATDLFLLFIGLELASLAIYVLVAFQKESTEAGEAGVKYFITGSLSSAVGLYGLSLLFVWNGNVSLVGANSLPIAWAAMSTPDPIAIIGLGLMLVGFGFKVSAVPFHFAAPDAYAGTTAPVAGLLATASKAMGFAALLRILLVVAAPNGGDAFWLGLLGIISVVTMTWGNLAALTSENPKRMLAYSSVAHAGYMLAAITAAGSGATDAATSQLLVTAVIFHLAVLVFFKLGAFLVISMMEMEGRGSNISDFNGLAKRDPIIAVAMFVFMLSLAGVPPFSGFLSKLLMLTGIVQASAGTGAGDASGLLAWALSSDWILWLAVAIGLNSALSLFYYLRIGLVMFREEGDRTRQLARAPFLRIVIVVSLVATLAFGLGDLSDRLLNMAAFAAQHLLI
jgi:NADH:ubiquinone oxidoreductase subunit 2 (subunit N)